MGGDGINRRQVVAGIGLAPVLGAQAAAQSVPSPAPPNRLTGRPEPVREKPPGDPPEARVGWAVAGLGKFAVNQIIPSFDDTRHSRLAGFVSGSQAKLADHGRRHDVRSLYGYDLRGLADDRTVHVVYVITPNSLHADLAVRALDAGKHVFCEKPMATTIADCQRMIRAAKANNRLLAVGYRQHFEPHNVEALRRLRAGEIGPLRFYTSDHGRPVRPEDPADRWRIERELAGGGSLFDIGIYSLNGSILYAGEEPELVSASVQSPPGDPRFREVEDRVAWTMRFPSGLLANCSSSYSTAEVKRLQLFGTEASLRLDPATDYYRNDLTRVDDRGESQLEVQGQSAEQFTGEIDAFSQAVRGRAPNRTPGEMGLRDVRLMLAIYRAAREGRPVRV